MQGDGSSLSKAKKFGPQYKNDIPVLLKAWTVLHSLGEGGLPKEAKKLCWHTPVKDITENDYILSANTYNPYSGEEEVSHREPKEILKEIEEKERKMLNILKGMKNPL